MKIESFYSDKHLTYEELVEYSRGNLSNSEMHRLELHLIDCELCNEALNGVNLLGYEDASGSIERIKEATGGKESKGLGLYHYIGIAASIILIAVIGFIFTRSSDQPERLAEQSRDTQEKSIADAGKPGKKETLAIDSVQDQGIDTTYLAVTEVQEDNEQTVRAQPVIKRQEIDTASPAVQPIAVEPVVGEEIIIAAEYDIASPDSAIQTQLKEDSAPITMSGMTAEEDQQAVAKSRMAVPSEAKPVQEAPAIQTEQTADYVAAEPDRGMRAYERYLKRNLQYPEGARENAIEGDVVLNVTINIDGSIGEITVKTSLGYGCDQEAMRLVREGPSWTPATRGGSPVTEQVTVTVPFRF